jgi:hypothetical protein
MVDLKLSIIFYFLFNFNFCVSQMWLENDLKDCLRINNENMTFMLDIPSDQRKILLVPFFKQWYQEWSEEDLRPKRQVDQVIEEHSLEDLTPSFLLDLVQYFQFKKLIIFIDQSSCKRPIPIKIINK